MNQGRVQRLAPHERILIIKPSSLGDIVHALPVLAALREAYPDAHIAWLVGTSFAPLLHEHPLLDEVISFDRRRFGKMLRSPRIALDFLRFVGELRRRRFDLVIDLQGLIRSGFLALASGARDRVGFASARELAWLFYSRKVRCPATARHAVDRNMALAAAIGLDGDSPRFPLGLRPEETLAAQALLRKEWGRPLERFTAVMPGARWATKRWKLDRIAELIDRLHGEGAPRCVLLGSPEDRPIAERILAECETDVLDLVGKTTLRELVAVISLADRVLCHDSGPMHVAAALDKPLVAIFGPTDPARTGPYSAAAETIATPLDCAACYQRRCWHHSCMEQLEVETVLVKLRDLDRNVLGRGVGSVAER